MSIKEVLNDENSGECSWCKCDENDNKQGKEIGVVLIHDSRHEADKDDRWRQDGLGDVIGGVVCLAENGE